MNTTMEQLAERVRKVIIDNRYLTMATHDGNSVWIAPLAYAVEPNYGFIYYSGMNSRHSTHTAKKPIVACSIYNSSLSSDDVDGIQFSAKVTRVADKDLLHVIPLYFRQSFPIEEIRLKWLRPIENFKGIAVQRFYRIEPLDMFTIDLESIKVDKRVEVSLNVLRQIPMEK